MRENNCTSDSRLWCMFVFANAFHYNWLILFLLFLFLSPACGIIIIINYHPYQHHLNYHSFDNANNTNISTTITFLHVKLKQDIRFGTRLTLQFVFHHDCFRWCAMMITCTWNIQSFYISNHYHNQYNLIAILMTYLSKTIDICISIFPFHFYHLLHSIALVTGCI